MNRRVFYIGLAFFCFVGGILLSNSIKSKIKSFYHETPFTEKSKEINLNDSIHDFYLKIKDSDFDRLKLERDLALKESYLPDCLQSYHQAELKYNNQKFNAKIALTGGLKEHFNHINKWSFKLKLENGKKIKGMSKFAFIYPKARGYLTDWVAYKLLKARGGIGLKVGFCDVHINKKYFGLYYIEERFGNHILKNNGLENGIIFRMKIALKTENIGTSFNFNTNLKFYNLKNILSDSALKSQLSEIKQLWFSFYSGTREAKEVFDLKKFATVFAVSDLMNSKHGYSVHNLRFYYNPTTKLFEPIGREWMDIDSGPPENKKFGSLTIEGELSENVQWDNVYLKNLIIETLYKNVTLQEMYIKELEVISERKYLDSILKNNDTELNIYINKIKNYDSTYNFPYSKLYKNQKSILQKLYPETPSIRVYYKGLIKNKIELLVINETNLHQEISEIKYSNYSFLNSNFIIYPKYVNPEGQKLELKINEDFSFIDFNKSSLDIIFGCLGVSPVMTNYLNEKIINMTVAQPHIAPKNLNDYNLNSRLE